MVDRLLPFVKEVKTERTPVVFPTLTAPASPPGNHMDPIPTLIIRHKVNSFPPGPVRDPPHARGKYTAYQTKTPVPQAFLLTGSSVSCAIARFLTRGRDTYRFYRGLPE
ncbi:unnamed protein product [Gadus morhua 'NCC']